MNVTLVFSAPQAIMAAKAGAYFVSPFVGRLDDVGQNGMDLINDIVTSSTTTNSKPKFSSPPFVIRSTSFRPV